MKHLCSSLLAIMAVTSPAMAQGFNPGGNAGNMSVPLQITAKQGINWSQKTNTVTTIGDTKAVRGAVTITANQLIAHYSSDKPQPSNGATNNDGLLLNQGNSQLSELDAIGNVHIYTSTDNAWGDQAIYDVHKGVLVLTGKNLKLTTPKDTLTARDSIEYYTSQHKAVARGNAHIVTNDQRSISADVIVGYFSTQPGKTNAETLEKVTAIGHVVITSKADTATGDRAVYLPDTQEARLGGHVRITHNGNQLTGADALVNMKTGTAILLAAPGQQVSGVIIPNSGKTE